MFTPPVRYNLYQTMLKAWETLTVQDPEVEAPPPLALLFSHAILDASEIPEGIVLEFDLNHCQTFLGNTTMVIAKGLVGKLKSISFIMGTGCQIENVTLWPLAHAKEKVYAPTATSDSAGWHRLSGEFPDRLSTLMTGSVTRSKQHLEFTHTNRSVWALIQ